MRRRKLLGSWRPYFLRVSTLIRMWTPQRATGSWGRMPDLIFAFCLPYDFNRGIGNVARGWGYGSDDYQEKCWQYSRLNELFGRVRYLLRPLARVAAPSLQI